MKYFVNIICLIQLCNANLLSQNITGRFFNLKSKSIQLVGFNGLRTYEISDTKINANGVFKLDYSKTDFGIGYLKCDDSNPFFVILSGEDIEIVGEDLNDYQKLIISKGKENQSFYKYLRDNTFFQKSLSAWDYLEQTYENDESFHEQRKIIITIQKEKKRINNIDNEFIKELPNDSYLKWFLPIRKLIGSVPYIAQYQPKEIQSTLENLRKINLIDNRLYKSGLYKDIFDSHFWLIENSGLSIEQSFEEMKIAINSIINSLISDEIIFNEVSFYLFELFEKHSLYQASEYLAIKLLNETSCTLNDDLSKQLETYRTMKIGNIAPTINFGENSYLNGTKQVYFKNLSDLTTPYTLVIFGANWCHKCSEELPQIIENYVKWRNNGVEVVFVSLDTDSIEFLQTVKQNPFFTYCDFKKWESTVVQDYFVFGTPTMFLLDSKREILLRPNSVKQMDAWVDWFLINKKE
jgi:thiol-disulfide isomerase/thioredoxin